jgi:hypothetical protein
MTYFVIVLFSFVVWLTKGFYDPSIPLLVLSFLVWVFLRIFKPSANSDFPKFYRFYPWMSAFLIAIKPSLMYVDESLKGIFSVYRLLPIGLNFLKQKWVPFLFLVFLMGVLFLSPHPFIDVFRSNNLGVDFLLQGLNPYSQIYPDIYDGRFDYHTGYLYWPMALYLQTLSKLFFQDIRAISVLLWWGAAFFIPTSHQRHSELKKIWWLIPFGLFGLEQGWLDPMLSAAAMVALWALKERKWFLMAIAVAMGASIKQYGFIIGFFSVLYLIFSKEWKPSIRVILFSGSLFLLALCPFLIWNLSDFISMTITAHSSAMARPEALNFTALWMKTMGTSFPGITQAIMTAVGFLLAIFHVIKNRFKRKLAVIPEAWAMAFGFSMMFGKFAFCNYYWLLISFWMMSLAFEDADKSQI